MTCVDLEVRSSAIVVFESLFGCCVDVVSMVGEV